MIAGAKTDVATKKTTPYEASWIYGPHEYSWRETPPCATSLKGQTPADRVNFVIDKVPWPEQRLRRKRDFKSLREQGVSRSNPLLVLRTSPNGLAHSRFGFAIGRRVASSAVVRNRLKRRLRDLVRRAPTNPGWDMLIIPRTAAIDVEFNALQQALANVMERAHVLKPEPFDDPVKDRNS